MSKYSLIHELCESRIFRSKQAMSKYSKAKGSETLYAVLLSTIALALTPKTHAWAKKYAAKSGAFGNFDFFRPTATDLYVLTHMALERGVIGQPAARSLLRLYKELGKGNVDSSFAEQALLRAERALRVRDARLRNARRALTHWSHTSESDQKLTIENLYRIVRQHAKLAEVLPYLKTATAREPGHFGKLGAYAAAVGGAALAGIAIGYRYDTGSRWGRLNNSAEFNGEKLLTEDRPTQLFTIVQNLNQHPDIEKIISVHYLADGITALVRCDDGNAYELEIRPAPFAKSHDEKRGVTESEAGKIACLKCDEVSTEKAWQKNDNFCPKCKDSNQGVAESCWEWEITNVIMERNDAAITGNDAATIARSAKQAAEKFDKADKGGNGVPEGESVQDHLKNVRAMYGVEIVDDFIDVLELPNSEDDTDKQTSLFSKDNR